MYPRISLYEQFDLKDEKCLLAVPSIEVQEKRTACKPSFHVYQWCPCRVGLSMLKTQMFELRIWTRDFYCSIAWKTCLLISHETMLKMPENHNVFAGLDPELARGGTAIG